MTINPYLNFAGTCEEAFQLYAQVLGGKIEFMQRFGETPMGAQLSAEWKNKLMHARLNAKGSILMGSDAPPDRFKPGQGYQVSLQVDQPAEADRIFAALSEGGRVTMPLQETEWALRFGMAVDRFGIPWMINCHKPA